MDKILQLETTTLKIYLIKCNNKSNNNLLKYITNKKKFIFNKKNMIYMICFLNYFVTLTYRLE